MNGNRVFVGQIKRCNSFVNDDGSQSYVASIDRTSGKEIICPDRVIKENALLIEVVKGYYIDVDQLKGNIGVLKTVLTTRALRIAPRYFGDEYVDRESLLPYYSTKNQKTSIRQLKKVRINKICR